MNINKMYGDWKANAEIERANIASEIIENGEQIVSVHYIEPGDGPDTLWYLDIYVCEDKVYQIKRTSYGYCADLKMLGTAVLEEDSDDCVSAPVMTNKELIDYCNATWNKVHRCTECPYHDTYCDKFRDKYGDTPFLNDPEHHWGDGSHYTDEGIKL